MYPHTFPTGAIQKRRLRQVNIFLWKSLCAVDPTGIRTVIAAAKVATSKGLTVVTGNQRRHRRDYWEAYVQVKNGLIGDVVSSSAHWDQGHGGISANVRNGAIWNTVFVTGLTLNG